MVSIQIYREKAGLTQEALADLCGWKGNGRISNYEKGVRTPGIDDLKTIQSALARKGVRASLEQLSRDPEPKTA